jgi:hypothetical protein
MIWIVKTVLPNQAVIVYFDTVLQVCRDRYFGHSGLWCENVFLMVFGYGGAALVK